MTQRSEIDAAIAKMRKEFGDRTVVRADDDEVLPVSVISTGIFSLDRALRCGGFPRGRIIEVYGWESSCKTALTLLTAAACQREGGEVLFVDAEQTLDSFWAERAFGVNASSVVTVNPDNCEQAFAIIDEFIAKKIDLIIVDSVEGLVPRAEMEGEVGESHMGVKARLMNQALRRMNNALVISKTTMIFINQLRQKIGVVYGNPDTTPGGNGLRLWSSVRIEAKKGQAIKEGDRELGKRISFTVVKSKVGPPRGKTEVDYYYDDCDYGPMGFDLKADLFDVGLASGVIVKEGNTYSFAGERLAVGRAAAAKQFENLKLADAVKAAVRKVGA